MSDSLQNRRPEQVGRDQITAEALEAPTAADDHSPQGAPLSVEWLPDAAPDDWVAPNCDHSDYDPLSEPKYGPTFLEQVLLAVIDGHPAPPHGRSFSQDALTRTPEQRLAAALEALTWQKPSPLRWRDEDIRLLEWMAMERHVDNIKRGEARRRSQNFNLRSIRRIAIETVEKRSSIKETDFTEVEIAFVNRLREKYTGVYWRKQGDLTAENMEQQLIYLSTVHEYIAESIQGQDFARIAPIFRKHGVAMTRNSIEEAAKDAASDSQESDR